MRDDSEHRLPSAAREGGIFLSFRSTLAYGLYKNPGASLQIFSRPRRRSTRRRACRGASSARSTPSS